MRSNALELGFYFVGHVERVDKVRNALDINGWICSRQVLESFVWLFITFATQNCLDGFCHNAPSIVEVAVDSVLIKDEFTKPFEDVEYGRVYRFDDVAEKAYIKMH